MIFKKSRSWDVIRRRVASIETAQNTLEYQPAVKLDEGLEYTYSWLKTVL